MQKALISQLDREDLQKVYSRAAEFPSISTKLIKDLINTEYFYELTYGHVKDLESILGKKIIEIFPGK